MMTVTQMQHLLGYLGYDTGGCDGICGGITRQAVMSFQTAWEGLDADGVPGEKTQAALIQAVAEGFQRPLSPAPAVKESGFWEEIEFFTREEFQCRCGEYHGPYCDGFPAEPSETLVRLADRVRQHFGKPAIRSSGVRCVRHNADSGGVKNSKHLTGKALDFMVKGVEAEEVLRYVKQQPETAYAYCIDESYIHMDVD